MSQIISSQQMVLGHVQEILGITKKHSEIIQKLRVGISNLHAKIDAIPTGVSAASTLSGQTTVSHLSEKDVAHRNKLRSHYQNHLKQSLEGHRQIAKQMMAHIPGKTAK